MSDSAEALEGDNKPTETNEPASEVPAKSGTPTTTRRPPPRPESSSVDSPAAPPSRPDSPTFVPEALKLLGVAGFSLDEEPATEDSDYGALTDIFPETLPSAVSDAHKGNPGALCSLLLSVGHQCVSLQQERQVLVDVVSQLRDAARARQADAAARIHEQELSIKSLESALSRSESQRVEAEEDARQARASAMAAQDRADALSDQLSQRRRGVGPHGRSRDRTRSPPQQQQQPQWDASASPSPLQDRILREEADMTAAIASWTPRATPYDSPTMPGSGPRPPSVPPLSAPSRTASFRHSHGSPQHPHTQGAPDWWPAGVSPPPSRAESPPNSVPRPQKDETDRAIESHLFDDEQRRRAAMLRYEYHKEQERQVRAKVNEERERTKKDGHGEAPTDVADAWIAALDERRGNGGGPPRVDNFVDRSKELPASHGHGVRADAPHSNGTARPRASRRRGNAARTPQHDPLRDRVMRGLSKAPVSAKVKNGAKV